MTLGNGSSFVMPFPRLCRPTLPVTRTADMPLTFVLLAPPISGSMQSINASGYNTINWTIFQDHIPHRIHTLFVLWILPKCTLIATSSFLSIVFLTSLTQIHIFKVLSILPLLMAGKVVIGYVKRIGMYYDPKQSCFTIQFHHLRYQHTLFTSAHVLMWSSTTHAFHATFAL